MTYSSNELPQLLNGILSKGSRKDLEKRIETHNKELVQYCSRHIPWELVLFEEFKTRSEALHR